MRSNDQSKPGQYQLWWNLTTKTLELHAVNCAHGPKLREGHSVQDRRRNVFAKYQPFGQAIPLPDAAAVEALNQRAVRLGQHYTPVAHDCAAPHYKGASA